MLSLLGETHSHTINSTQEITEPESRPYTLCTWSLIPDSPEVLMIEDLAQDARFRDFHLVVNPPYLRSYVGAPVVLTNGHRVGVMCAVGTQPRSTDAAATRLLVNVAGLVAREIEAIAGLGYPLPLAAKARRSKQQGLMIVDTGKQGWHILYSACDDDRLDGNHTEGQPFWETFAIPDVAQPGMLLQKLVGEGAPFKVRAALVDKPGLPVQDGKSFELEFRPGDAALPSLYVPMGTQVGTPAWIPESPEETADVAKIWFVIITASSKKHAVGSPTPVGPPVGPSADAHVDSDADIDRRNGPVASCSGQPPVVLSTQGFGGGWEDVQVGYLVGRGARGSVYRATCNGQQVAVKVIAPEQDKYIKRTPDGTPMEVALTRGLHHPNIVHALRHASFASQNASLSVLQDTDIGSTDSFDSLWGQEPNEHPSSHPSPEATQETWLMLEYCDRGSLLDAVDRGWLYTSHASHSTGVTDLQKLLLTALELAKALAYLHSMDVMHGDLTGGNVLLQSSTTTPEDPRGFTVKVADFGMSRIHTDTQQTPVQGTITHMPPELISHGHFHMSADVWAFGVLLWEMYSGHRAWLSLSYSQVKQAIGQEQRSPEWPVDAPTELAALGRACCSVQPDHRPSFKQLVQLLSGMPQLQVANS